MSRSAVAPRWIEDGLLVGSGPAPRTARDRNRRRRRKDQHDSEEQRGRTCRPRRTALRRRSGRELGGWRLSAAWPGVAARAARRVRTGTSGRARRLAATSHSTEALHVQVRIHPTVARMWRTGRQLSGSRRKISEALVPPKPKELDSAASISRFRPYAARGRSRVSTTGLSRLSVGGTIWSRMARIQKIASTAPAAPSRWPIADLVDDIEASRRRCRAAARPPPARSCRPCVEVPCALT